MTPHCVYPLMPPPSYVWVFRSVQLSRRGLISFKGGGHCTKSLGGPADCKVSGELHGLPTQRLPSVPHPGTSLLHLSDTLKPDQGNLERAMCLSFLVPSLEEH